MKSERCLIKKITYLIVIILGVTFTKGSYYDPNIYAKLDDITLELGDTLPKDIINKKGVLNTAINNSYTIATNAPLNENEETIATGNYSYFLVYNDNIYQYSKITNIKANITIVDTIKPIITIKDNLKFKYNSKVSVDNIAECFDLSTCHLSINENIDTTVSGEKTITIVAKDESGNTNYATAKITIEKKPVVKSYSYSGSYNQLNEHNNELNSSLTEDEKNSLREQIVSFAKQFIGNPYVYGGTSLTNGTDCSGFTMSVYGHFNYRLPRVAIAQNYVGKQVSREELMKGDIIVYHYNDGGGHVGIYAGNGMMVHAGTSRTGIVMVPIFDGYKTYVRIIY